MASATSLATFCRSQSMSVFGSPGYRLMMSGNRPKRRATALMGPAESARSSANASAQAARSGSRASSAGGS
eukprot:9385458-Alexandrium_andersonii.AAC.1